MNEVNAPSPDRVGSFHILIGELIERLYPKGSQSTSRIILKAYFSQSPDRNRSMTLESLGKIPELKKDVSRERSRQILKSFKENLVKEIQYLDRGHDLNDEIMLKKRKDILRLREIIASIINEIETFSFPIFADRMQSRLKRLNLVDDKIFFPVVIELANSFSLDFHFKISPYEGRRLILKEEWGVQEYSSDILQYAAKIATHLGGACSVDALINPSWDDKAPKSISLIPKEIREKYIFDLLSREDGFILLQDSTYYAFKNRDERVSSILMPIFLTYKKPIDSQILFNAIRMSLTHRFRTHKNDEKRKVELSIIESSNKALDEFCQRTLILDSVGENLRKPGKHLIVKMRDYTFSDSYKKQAEMVRVIKKRGRPVTSMEFGAIFRNDLNLPPALRSVFYTYPVLFYKEGEGRRNDLYKVLDGEYRVEELNIQSISQDVGVSSIVNDLLDKIHDLQNESSGTYDGDIAYGKVRKEQGLLRDYLLAISEGVQMTNGDKSCKCMLCNRFFPSELLVAAHVKKRSACSLEEKSDIKNIAMLQCGGCDKLFESGFVFVSEEGAIRANDNAPLTDEVITKLVKLVENEIEYFDGSEMRLNYLKHHRERSLKKWSR